MSVSSLLDSLFDSTGVIGYRDGKVRTRTSPKGIALSTYMKNLMSELDTMEQNKEVLELSLSIMKDKAKVIDEVAKKLYARQKLEDDDNVDTSYFNTERFELIRNMILKDDYYVYDKEADTVTPINGDAYMEETGAESNLYFVEYNPTISERKYTKLDEVGEEMPCLNTYTTPKWLESPLEKPNPPKVFLDYMGCLLPDKVNRKVVVSWIRNSLLNRCETYLVMNGPKGIGKGLLADEVLARLIGEGNYRKAGSGFLSKEFNSILDKSRIIHIDEFSANSRGVTAKLKNYINSKVSVEKKNRDEVTMTHYNSFIISSNDLADIQIFSDDRRFSVIDLNPMPDAIKKTLGEDKIVELLELLDSEEVVAHVGSWFLKEGVEAPYSSLHYAHKGRHFWKLVRSTLTVWQRTLIETLYKNYKEIKEAEVFGKGKLMTMKNIRKSFGDDKRNCPKDWLKIENFINQHFDEEGNPPASINSFSGERFLVPNAKYLKKWEEEEKEVGVENEEALTEFLKQKIDDEDEDIF